MRVLVAVDSFKGSIGAPAVAAAIGAGWSSVRPGDTVDLLPLADGGEGTAEVIAAATAGAVVHEVAAVTGPDGRKVTGEWVELPGGVAVVDLAQMSGLPLMRELDPRGATTRGLGEVVRAAVESGMSEVWIGLGGSASTDGGVGALRALGMRALDARGCEVPDGGIGLRELDAVDLSGLLPIPGGVRLLTDVTSPLTGAAGAAAVFGPQKGADPVQVRILDRALARLADVLGADLGVDAETAGAGAAGGTAFGFAAVYGAAIVPGADEVARLTRLDERIALADLVITGEGAFDAQSRRGKLVGNVLTRAATAGKATAVIAGVLREDPGVPAVGLVELAGSSEAALRFPARWARAAGARLASTSAGSRSGRGMPPR
ncbi:glycerate kinase [Microbacterium sp.]|uniref:glycerate kinase family protein n=1 Tax=Microbacterium sp. TaxID=51671 RepID=UPI0039E5B67D